MDTMQHWTITREAGGLARLTFDKAGATTNTLSAAVLTELNQALDELDRDPPKGLIIASGKANGFIAGADIDATRRWRWSAASASAAGWSWRSRAATGWSSTSRVPGWACPR